LARWQAPLIAAFGAVTSLFVLVTAFTGRCLGERGEDRCSDEEPPPGPGGGRSRAQPRGEAGKRNGAANAVPVGMSSARTAYTLPLTRRVRRRISSPTP